MCDIQPLSYTWYYMYRSRSIVTDTLARRGAFDLPNNFSIHRKHNTTSPVILSRAIIYLFENAYLSMNSFFLYSFSVLLLAIHFNGMPIKKNQSVYILLLLCSPQMPYNHISSKYHKEKRYIAFKNLILFFILFNIKLCVRTNQRVRILLMPLPM